MVFSRVRGTRDFLPEDMAKRRYVIDTIREVYQRYGFGELETPALENWSLLSAKSGGGAEIIKNIFRFKDLGGRMLGLRFDLTVPLARVVANNPQLPKPFRRYCVSRVWRYERPTVGRYREFWQADVDIVGSQKPESDLETLSAVIAALKALGFGDFKVKINDRRLLEGLVLAAGLKDAPEVFRCIDKLSKIGREGVEKELQEKKFEKKKVSTLLDWLESGGDALARIKGLVDNDVGRAGIKELEELFRLSDAFGVREYLEFDPSLARGLDYYTGPIFEVVSPEAAVGSLAGGGRYDGLIGTLGGEKLPATGISIGIERVIAVMDERSMLASGEGTTVLVAPISNNLEDAARIAQDLRNDGVGVELEVMGRGVSKALSYANSVGTRYVVLVGAKELAEGRVVLRDMELGEQRDVRLDDLPSALGDKDD